MFNEAFELWRIYFSVAQPEEVSRIAVRYINRLLIPLPIIGFADYLTAPPALPKNAPQHLSAFFAQAVVHDAEGRIAATITQAIESGPQAGKLPILLDIDAYMNKAFEPDDDLFRNLFAELREMKNRIFFSSLTTKAVELFL